MPILGASPVQPFYQDQAAIDAARLAVMRHTTFGAPKPELPETPGRVSYPQLRVAASYDPAAFRAFWKVNGMVCPPEQVYTDPDVVACTRETLRQHGGGPPAAQPTRAAPRRPGAVSSRASAWAAPQITRPGQDRCRDRKQLSRSHVPGHPGGGR
jgi:hypothetical protein